MNRLVWLCLAGAAGCSPSFETVDAACLDTLGNAEALGDTSPDLLLRINCYRRFLGLSEMAVSAGVQGAVEAHLAYLGANDVLNPESPDYSPGRNQLLAEVEGRTRFSGVSPYARQLAAGTVGATGGIPDANVWGWVQLEASESADDLLMNPWARDMFFQPLVLGVGHATGAVSGTEVGYLDLTSAVPSGQRVLSPVVYPRDGQAEVPPGYLDPFARSPELFFGRGPVGFPITVTVSGDGRTFAAYDPYGVTVDSATLTDDEGNDVPLQRVAPSPGFALLTRTTAIFYADAPLQPGTGYRFQAELVSTTNSYVRRLDIDTRFETSAAPTDTDTDTDPVDTDTDPLDTDTDPVDTDTDPADTDTDPADTDTDPA